VANRNDPRLAKLRFALTDLRKLGTATNADIDTKKKIDENIVAAGAEFYKVLDDLNESRHEIAEMDEQLKVQKRQAEAFPAIVELVEDVSRGILSFEELAQQVKDMKRMVE
jgi:hypothetical protein